MIADAADIPGKNKAPFPAFGGKSRIGSVVYSRIDGVRDTPSWDPVRNMIEPFFFSGGEMFGGGK